MRDSKIGTVPVEPVLPISSSVPSVNFDLVIYLPLDIYYHSKHYKQSHPRGYGNPGAEFEESDVRAKKFEYNVLRAATKNFAEERKLGQGAYGAVYKVRF